MFGASNLHSLTRTPACIPADAKMEFPGGPAVGVKDPHIWIDYSTVYLATFSLPISL